MSGSSPTQQQPNPNQQQNPFQQPQQQYNTAYGYEPLQGAPPEEKESSFERTARIDKERRAKNKEEQEIKDRDKIKEDKENERNKEKFGNRGIDYNQPANFKDMTSDQFREWREKQLTESKHSISVPVTGRDISQILDNYRETKLYDNIDDQIDSISSRLKSINTSYKLEDDNNKLTSTSVENKALELFGKDIKTPWGYFIEDFKDNWKEFKKFSASLFELPTIENWKYVIFGVMVIVSYRLSMLHQDFEISQLRTIFPNLFLIGCIIYTLFSFTNGKDIFFGNGDNGYTTIITFCIILLLLALTNVVDMPEYITGMFNPNIIDKLIVIPILLLIFANFTLLFLTKDIKSSVFILWFVITLLYIIDLIVNADNVSTSHIIWSLVAPSLLVLLGKTHSKYKIMKYIPFTEFTCGLFLALFINELFVYDIENIIFS